MKTFFIQFYIIFNIYFMVKHFIIHFIIYSLRMYTSTCRKCHKMLRFYILSSCWRMVFMKLWRKIKVLKVKDEVKVETHSGLNVNMKFSFFRRSAWNKLKCEQVINFLHLTSLTDVEKCSIEFLINIINRPVARWWDQPAYGQRLDTSINIVEHQLVKLLRGSR